ncbi:hypothetical protein [Paenibacillus sp. BK033]|uniref:hypothetical protein n=1 Tax=Paenibacillus sp. BK033 TaxID=2512133 RepID=UPI001053477B|nr:hypothetical protein [Paenibacillus sp. BK033]
MRLLAPTSGQADRVSYAGLTFNMKRRKPLAHRLAYYYRKLNEHTARQLAIGKARPLRTKRLIAYRERLKKEVGDGWEI